MKQTCRSSPTRAPLHWLTLAVLSVVFLGNATAVVLLGYVGWRILHPAPPSHTTEIRE